MRWGITWECVTISEEKIPKERTAMDTWITKTAQTTGPFAASRTLPKQRKVAYPVVPCNRPAVRACKDCHALAIMFRVMESIARNSSGRALIRVTLTSKKIANLLARPVEVGSKGTTK